MAPAQRDEAMRKNQSLNDLMQAEAAREDGKMKKNQSLADMRDAEKQSKNDRKRS
jgi:hypothetical protein